MMLISKKELKTFADLKSGISKPSFPKFEEFWLPWEKSAFFALWDLEFEIRLLSYILLCDIHHSKSVPAKYHLLQYRFGKQKQKLSD